MMKHKISQLILEYCSNTLIVLFTILVMTVVSNAQTAITVGMNASSELAYNPNNNSMYLLGFLLDENFTNRALYKIDLDHPIPEKVMDGANISNVKISPNGELMYINKADSMFVYNSATMELLYDFKSELSSLFYFEISPLDPHLIAVRSDGLVMFKNGVVLPEVATDHQYSDLIFSTTQNHMYTIRNTSSFNPFHLVRYDDQGAYFPDTVYQYTDGRAFLKLWDELVYTSDGTTIDVSGEVPVYYGQHTKRINNSLQSGSVDMEVSAIEFTGSLIDQSQNQIIQIRSFQDKQEYFFFDKLRLTLQERKTLSVPRMSNDGQFVQFGDGLNFAYVASEKVVIVKDCGAPISAPIFPDVYDQELPLCVENNVVEPIIITPPAGFDILVDEQGNVYDTMSIIYEGVYRLRVMDEFGCPSLPGESIRLNSSYIPSTPTLLVLSDFGYNSATTAELCTDGKLYLGAYNFNNDEVTNLWSTGDTTQYISVDSDESVWVKAVSPGGCVSAVSDTLFISNIASTPPVDIEISGLNFNTNICAASSVDLQGPDGYDKYLWRHMEEFSSDQEINVRTIEELFLSLQVKSVEGCWSEPFSTQVEIENGLLPPKPKIQQIGDLLSSDEGAIKYTWYRDGDVIIGEDQAVLQATQAGDYQLRIGNAKCWGPLSNILNIP